MGQRDHFIHRKHIKRSSACGATPTEQVLIADGWSQMYRKANQFPWNDVGQRIKQKGIKGFWDGQYPGQGGGGGDKKKESLSHNRKLSQAGSLGSLGTSGGKQLRKFTTWIAPNGDHQLRSSSHDCIHLQWVRVVGWGLCVAVLGGTGCIVSLQGKDQGWLPWGNSEAGNVS